MLRVAGDLVQGGYSAYLRDESKMAGGRAELLFFPECEADVAEALAELARQGLPATISGGRTGIVGGAAPLGGGLVSLERMNGILGLRRADDTDEWLIRLSPGVTVADLSNRLAKKDFSAAAWPKEDQAALAAFVADGRAYFYPVDATEDSAQIGGNVATNASGGRSFHYGPTRPHVRGLRVVLADGTAMALRRGDGPVADGGFGRVSSGKELPAPAYDFPGVKNAAGYYARKGLDLIDLFIGAEGTLGVITEIELALTPKPEKIVAFLIFCPDLDAALNLVERVHALSPPERPLAVEFFDRRSLDFLRATGQSANDAILAGLPRAEAAILLELATSEAGLEDLLVFWDEFLTGCGLSSERAWFEEKETAHNRLRHLRHALPEAVNNTIARRQNEHASLHKVSTDFAVPAPFLRGLFQRYEAALGAFDYVIFGHVGDAHLHANVLPKDYPELEAAKAAYRDLARWVVGVGGTVSAEHGIGKLKREMLALMYGPEAMAEMKRIKDYFDPEGRLNPGVMWV